jgi:hypothetical protein
MRGLQFWRGHAHRRFAPLTSLGITAQDVRIADRFSGERAIAVSGALAEASRTISRMPANFVCYPNSQTPVFEAAPQQAPKARHFLLELDQDARRAYSTLLVPGHVLRTMQRLGAWREPVLLAEWARLTRSYGDRMGRIVLPGEVEAALAWLDPSPDTGLAREVARRLLEKGCIIHCVWSGARLSTGSLDIDPCLPWSAWPCGDPWNLLPASPSVNQRLKRDRLPPSPLWRVHGK